jgi:polyhydroxyalkanoate synthase
MQLMPTPRDVIHRDGTAALYKFRAAPAARGGGPNVERAGGPSAHSATKPVLLVPSMINRWYVLDLRAGSSLAGAMVDAGLETYCLDWGIAEDEDRYLTWEDVIARLARAVRVVKRASGHASVGLLGYCMGATLSGIYASLYPKEVAALINLAGPFDFSHAGLLGTMVDPRWFDAAAIAEAGNVKPTQMQSGFVALRPTSQIAKWVGLWDRGHDPGARDSFEALETWANDNIPFPGAAYRTYISELYQQNLLVKGEHHVGGRRVDLGEIRCPVMSVVTERDTICPPRAAIALNERCGSANKEVLTVPGGHVGAVVGSRASKVLYPAMARWLSDKLALAS